MRSSTTTTSTTNIISCLPGTSKAPARIFCDGTGTLIINLGKDWRRDADVFGDCARQR